MTSRFAIPAVAFGCILAAGTGGYLAVRTATDTSEAAPAPAINQTLAARTETAAALSPSLPSAVQDSVVSTPPRRTKRSGRLPETAPRQVARPAPAAAEPALPSSHSTDLSTQPVASLPPTVTPIESPWTPEPYPAASTTAPEIAVASTVPVELPLNTVIGIRLDSTISSETARVEDVVRARVTRPVTVDGDVVIPAGARLTGGVTFVEPGGKIRERARIGIRFTSISVSDDVRVPIQTETIYREGDPPAGEATAKIGASAVVGSILGGVFGGKKGAAIGGAAGAAGGTAMVVTGDRNPAVLETGTSLTVRLREPAVFHIER